MRYAHVAIGHPALQWEQLRKPLGGQLHLQENKGKLHEMLGSATSARAE
ncbi:hypothetical protein KSF_017540 [Reticulibacter mediterranei]|uniref:Uncharacterized protein n=1 Tax=Reticulibacter mediterranei TaxID=2778369 RepID=A0A8J3ICE1_9CHLR|nr:hypothetical protein [Reticulibacter mediterranei]GHO91706.1 hypothetical protein KSF_017540 [Reticulibacter mediterranei]